MKHLWIVRSVVSGVLDIVKILIQRRQKKFILLLPVLMLLALLLMLISSSGVLAPFLYPLF